MARRTASGRGAVLMEDRDGPSRFISFAPVNDPDVVERVLRSAEFTEHWSVVMALGDQVIPNQLRVVAASGS